jgi:hypothetical protein
VHTAKLAHRHFRAFILHGVVQLQGQGVTLLETKHYPGGSKGREHDLSEAFASAACWWGAAAALSSRDMRVIVLLCSWVWESRVVRPWPSLRACVASTHIVSDVCCMCDVCVVCDVACGWCVSMLHVGMQTTD